MALTCGLAAPLLDLRPSSDFHLLLQSLQKVRPISPSNLHLCMCLQIVQQKQLPTSQHKLMIYSWLTFDAEQIHSAKKPASCHPDLKQSCQLAAAQAASSRQAVLADGSHLLKWIKQQVEV